MPLYTYEKTLKTSDLNDDISFEPKNEVKTFEVTNLQGFNNENSMPSIWNVPQKTYSLLDNLATKSKLANVLIPALFILAGGFFIFKEFSPDIKQTLQERNGLLAQGTISPVSDEYINLSEYISNPVGLSKLTEEALSEHVLLDDQTSLAYDGIFYISIPALGFERLPVKANVDSTNEDTYLPALNQTLGHFKGTGLPISDIKNNMVIYGHSASSNYNPQRNDPVVGFSFLHELKVGDDIFIEIEGKRYHYKMYRSKIVEPTDVSIITGTPGKKTLTLFTCWPQGNNSSRYVAVAREAD